MRWQQRQIGAVRAEEGTVGCDGSEGSCVRSRTSAQSGSRRLRTFPRLCCHRVKARETGTGRSPYHPQLSQCDQQGCAGARLCCNPSPLTAAPCSFLSFPGQRAPPKHCPGTPSPAGLCHPSAPPTIDAMDTSIKHAFIPPSFCIPPTLFLRPH